MKGIYEVILTNKIEFEIECSEHDIEKILDIIGRNIIENCDMIGSSVDEKCNSCMESDFNERFSR